MGICKKCDNETDEDRDEITCDGGCRGSWHYKCLKLTKNQMESIYSCKQIKYVCNNCEKNPLNALAEKVNLILDFIYKLDLKIQEQDLTLKKVHENVETVRDKANDTDIEIIKDLKINLENLNVGRPTYSNIAKKNINRDNGRWIEVKSKNKGKTNNDIKEIIKQKISPVDMQVQGLRNGVKGSVLVECKSTELKKTVISNVQRELGEEYEVKEQELRDPKIKILSVENNLEETELLEMLKKQNDCFNKGTLRYVHKIEIKRKDSKYDSYTYILQVDGLTWSNLQSCNKKVNLGWRKYHVIEDTGVFRCFKCWNFNHTASKCQNNKQICGKCSEEGHKAEDCQIDQFKCRNCIMHNIKFKIGLDVKHCAWSKECPVYKRKIEEFRNKVSYI